MDFHIVTTVLILNKHLKCNDFNQIANLETLLKIFFAKTQSLTYKLSKYKIIEFVRCKCFIIIINIYLKSVINLLNNAIPLSFYD